MFIVYGITYQRLLGILFKIKNINTKSCCIKKNIFRKCVCERNFIGTVIMKDNRMKETGIHPTTKNKLAESLVKQVVLDLKGMKSAFSKWLLHTSVTGQTRQ